MAIARQLDMRIGDGVLPIQDMSQNLYTNVVRFFRYCASNGLCNVIASQTNNGGTGEDFHDGTNPIGENAFIVVEWLPTTGQNFYVMVQWASFLSSFGSSPGDPGLLLGGTAAGLGIQMAVRDDGTNPWPGTQNDDGLDRKGATPGTPPVWTDGASTVRVFPRSNATGGTHVTPKQNMAEFGDVFDVAPDRWHFVANENTILFVGDDGDSGTYDYYCILGRYTPRTGLESLLTTPYFMVSATAGTAGFPGTGSSVDYGDTAGTGNSGSTFQGGIVALPVNDVMTTSISLPSAGSVSDLYQPNMLISPNEYEPTPVSVLANESGKTGGPNGTGAFGLAGFADSEVWASVNYVPNNLTNAAGDIAYLGHTTVNNRKFALSWDGGAAPATNQTRTGRQSFTP